MLRWKLIDSLAFFFTKSSSATNKATIGMAMVMTEKPARVQPWQTTDNKRFLELVVLDIDRSLAWTLIMIDGFLANRLTVSRVFNVKQ